MRIVLLFGLCAGLLALWGCQAGEDQGNKTATQTPTNVAKQWMVMAGKTAGLDAPASLKNYRPQAMYEAIDGEADLFLPYQVQGMTVARFQTGRETIVAELFDLREPINAFGVFHQLRSPDDTAVPVGAEGASAGDQDVFFWRSRYVVRVIGAGDRPAARANLINLADNIAGQLPAESDLPAWVKALPQEPKPEAVRYLRQNVLGVDFFSSAVVGEYRLGDKDCQLVIVLAGKEARQQWEKARNFYQAPGRGDSFMGQDPAGEQVRARRLASYLVLLLGNGPAEAEEKLLKTTEATLAKLN